MSITTNWNPELYNEKHSFVYQHGEGLISYLEPKSHERILDLGCGSGQLTAKIHEMAKEAIGMDNSPEMVESARFNFPDIEFHTGDASDFSFDRQFDAIFSNATLHWVTDYNAAINCMFENLNPNGRLVLEFGGKGNVQTIVEQLRFSLAKRGYQQQSNLELWYFPSIGEYSIELEKAGFRVVMAQYFDRPTELADKESGIKDWISMFGESFFQDVAAGDIEEIKTEVQENVRPKCLTDGKWFADYKRLRIVAVKEA